MQNLHVEFFITEKKFTHKQLFWYLFYIFINVFIKGGILFHVKRLCTKSTINSGIIKIPSPCASWVVDLETLPAQHNTISKNSLIIIVVFKPKMYWFQKHLVCTACYTLPVGAIVFWLCIPCFDFCGRRLLLLLNVNKYKKSMKNTFCLHLGEQ